MDIIERAKNLQELHAEYSKMNKLFVNSFSENKVFELQKNLEYLESKSSVEIERIHITHNDKVWTIKRLLKKLRVY